MAEDPSRSLVNVNIGDLSKPATVLIEKIADAVGTIFQPYQITRIARAEAEADIIRAQGQIKVSDLQRRAMRRFIAEEAKKQENMEAITAKAIPQLEDTSKPQEVDDDWISNFFDKCRIVSDQEMQQIWARVLAGEANSPGTFSKRTVNFLSDLDKGEAELFSKLCGFGWVIGNVVVPLVYDVQADIYNRNRINFSTLSHLESIGLIQFDNLAGFHRRRLPKKFVVNYYGRLLSLEMGQDADNNLDLGRALLTRIGAELAPICGSEPADGFWEYIQDRWKGYLPKEVTEQVVAPNEETKQGAAQSVGPAPLKISDPQIR